MRKTTILVLSLLFVPLVASAQSYGPPPPPPDDAQGVDTTPPPDAEPDAPPPAPPAGNVYAQQAPAAPAGQWVHTPQYGWVWMPYGDQYVDGYGPRQYVYSIRFGWSWVAAPWLLGPGIHLWFGHLGPSRFGWYRGYGRYPRYYGAYRGYSRGGHVWQGGGYHRAAPIVRGGSRR
ncbi:MAG TPA: hypothetical protein VI356_07650 [Myxococcales bacterium]